MPLFDYTASDREGILSHGQIEAKDRQSAGKILAQQGLFVMGVTVATKVALPRVEEPPPPPPPPDPSPKPVAISPSTVARSKAVTLSDADPDAVFRARLEQQLIDDEKTVAVPSIKRPPVNPASFLPKRTWSRMDRALYLRQLQVMFEAGIPLYRSAAVLAEATDYNALVNAKLKEVPLDLERGRTLSKALERTSLFSPLIISSVRLGEESGRLDYILDALSGTEEKAVQLKRALVSRLTYPAVVLSAMCLGLLVLGHVMSRVMTSLPAFQKVEIPILGPAVRLFQHAAFLPVMTVLIGLFAYGLWRAWKHQSFRLFVEGRWLATPLVGPLLRRLEANSVAGHLALLVKAGLPLDRGLGLCATLVRTESFSQAMLLSQKELRDGGELSASFKRAELFPDDMMALVHSGEMSGSLEHSLETAASYCAEQVERTLESALAVVEPVLIGLMGIAIGAVLLLTFVPIFSTLKDL